MASSVICLELAKARRIEADQFAKARTIAMRRRETVDALKADLAEYAPGPDRNRAVWFYLNRGWATDTDMRLALEELEG
jgi:hypothetical protein